MESATIKKERSVLRAMFTRAASDFEGLLASSPNSLNTESKYQMLLNKFENLRTVQERYFKASLSEEVSENDLLQDAEAADEYEGRFNDLKLRFHASKRSEEDSSACVIDKGYQKRRFKLPQIVFRQFSGEIRDWQPFWNQFRKIDEDEDIDESDKIQYLSQATVPNSPARRIVESFPAIEGNYSKIIALLKERFGRKDLQIEVFVRELLSLVLKNSSEKGNFHIATLYDSIETQLRSLETLGVTSENCSAMLFPLVEGCLPEELLRVWQRSNHLDLGPMSTASQDRASLGSTDQVSRPPNRLDNLRLFLKAEVENEQRIALAAEGLGFFPPSTLKRAKSPVTEKFSTAAGLANMVVSQCIFCKSATHDGLNCFKAQDLNHERKREAVGKSKACFRCLKMGHQANRCKENVRCLLCRKTHVTLMCPDLGSKQEKRDFSRSKREGGTVHKEPAREKDSVSLGSLNSTRSHVFVRTLKVIAAGPKGSKIVRALIDSASQHSYIVTRTAESLGLKVTGSENLIHALFGGVNTKVKRHQVYGVRVSPLNQGDKGTLELKILNEDRICSSLPPVFTGPWTDELHRLGIEISDNEPGPIEILFGADVCGNLDTGERQTLECGLTAIQTVFGWTVIGKTETPQVDESLTALSVSMLSTDRDIANLWDLETLGIRDPIELKDRAEMAAEAEEFFLSTVRRDKEGRYVVRLPWLINHPPLPNNIDMATKRLESCIRRLKKDGMMEAYHNVLHNWMQEGIIEEVQEDVAPPGQVHYLPHRPVIKEGSTTPVRPVFDASAHAKGRPALNDCLEKGTNLIEQIPGLLLRFRTRRVGAIADIRKAFLQISVDPVDCDCLRFLWTRPDGSTCIYKHKRVVFGVSSSPFLLGSVIRYHLTNCLQTGDTSTDYSKKTVESLLKSFYVDNCVCSKDSKEEALTFMSEATAVLAEGKFDLRGWEFSNPERTVAPISVLGVIWDCNSDEIFLNRKSFLFSSEGELETEEPITKRHILSVVARIFDPIGFSSPATLLPKLLIQKTWERQLGWDVPVDEGLRKSFEVWEKQLPDLFSIKIPRWIHGGHGDRQLHIFCDASGDAYAAAVFLRVEDEGMVRVFLVAARTRVAPRKGVVKNKVPKSVSIPRLELLAALLGARLFHGIKEEFVQENSFFWSDSSTVIAWIRGSEEWAPFVGNRVREIRKLTPLKAWRHLPGRFNPADLPSRGCTPTQLKGSKWWEGPEWLLLDQAKWPSVEIQVDYEEVNKERRKVARCMVALEAVDWHLGYFSKFSKTVRMIAWCHRFKHNFVSNKRKLSRKEGPLSVEEIEAAEAFIFKLVQSEAFCIDDDRLKSLRPFEGEDGLIRLKTRLTEREDTLDFKFPIVLPGKHPLVANLIMYEHVSSCHTGTQSLLSRLRERFWILGGRRAVRSVIKTCVVCRRFAAKHFDVSPPSLPTTRVCDSRVFEIIGVDFAGPLFLSSKQKAWICLFTCSVYRAIHLELTTSMSTYGFMQVLRRFIARRGRPRIIYSDNGTNFVGTDNALQKIDWNTIQEYSSVKRIQWRFNPPTAAWWGGFWERLVGVLKQLLRKVLGKACLDYEDLSTVICDCESVVNSRPITYISEEADLQPLTPAMFLQDIGEVGTQDCDAVDQVSLTRKATHCNNLRLALRHRFRSEYLGNLRDFTGAQPTRPITLGDVVLVGSDDQRRLDWPLGHVVELIPGKDDEVRLVRVKTAKGLLLRPVRRLYPLEIVSSPVPSDHKCSAAFKVISDSCDGVVPVCEEGVVPIPDKSDIKLTRCGRQIKKPKKFVDHV